MSNVSLIQDLAQANSDRDKLQTAERVNEIVCNQILVIRDAYDRARYNAERFKDSHAWSYCHGLGFALAALGVNVPPLDTAKPRRLATANPVT